MENKNISLKQKHITWLNKHPDYNLSEKVRTMLDENMQNEHWGTEPIQHEPGITLGRNSITGNDIRYNRFDSPFDSNWIITGKSGTGKTTGSLIHLDQYLKHDEINSPLIISLDTQNAATALTKKHNGSTHSITETTAINPLHVTAHTDANLKPAPDKLAQLKGFFNVLFSGLNTDTAAPDTMEPIDGPTWTVLSYALKKTYTDNNIDITDPTTYNNPSPTIRDDLIPLLTKIANGVHTLSPNNQHQHRSVAVDILLQLDPLRFPDKIPGIMNGKTDLPLSDIENENLIQLQFDELPKLENTLPLFYTALINVYEWATTIPRPTIIHIDEAEQLLNTFETRAPLENMLRHTRHHNISMHLTMQNINQFVGTDHFDPIWSNCSHKLVYKDESILEVPSKALGMKTDHKQYVEQAIPGEEERGYSEVALQLPNTNWQPVQIYPQNESQDVFI